MGWKIRIHAKADSYHCAWFYEVRSQSDLWWCTWAFDTALMVLSKSFWLAGNLKKIPFSFILTPLDSNDLCLHQWHGRYLFYAIQPCARHTGVPYADNENQKSTQLAPTWVEYTPTVTEWAIVWVQWGFVWHCIILEKTSFPWSQQRGWIL